MPADDVGRRDRAVRASDADRERVAAIVRDAAGTGRLTLDEADERLRAIYAARYLADLTRLTADLPVSGRAVPAAAPALRPPTPARWRQAGWMPGYLYGYLALSVVLVVIWAATGAGYFWPVWPILGVGIKTFTHRGWPSRTWAGRGCAMRRS